MKLSKYNIPELCIRIKSARGLIELAGCTRRVMLVSRLLREPIPQVVPVCSYRGQGENREQIDRVEVTTCRAAAQLPQAVEEGREPTTTGGGRAQLPID